MERHKLKFRWLTGAYAIVRLAPDVVVPDWATRGEFTSITRSADELSIVCPVMIFRNTLTPRSTGFA